MGLKQISIATLPKSSELQAHECCLYVIREEESTNFKIGIARHPTRRLSVLQCGNPRRLSFFAVFSGKYNECRFVERSALAKFCADKRSEWVCSVAPDKLISFIRECEC